MRYSFQILVSGYIDSDEGTPVGAEATRAAETVARAANNVRMQLGPNVDVDTISSGIKYTGSTPPTAPAA